MNGELLNNPRVVGGSLIKTTEAGRDPDDLLPQAGGQAVQPCQDSLSSSCQNVLRPMCRKFRGKGSHSKLLHQVGQAPLPGNNPSGYGQPFVDPCQAGGGSSS